MTSGGKQTFHAAALPHEVKRLLVATDLSARSDRPLERALELASRHGAALTVLHVIDENLPDAAQEPAIQAARAEMQACVDKLGKGCNVPVTLSVVPGCDHQDILAAADAVQADIIMLGVHRNDPDRALLTGTTMEKVLRTGTVPVLVVANQVRGSYKTVVIAVDFSIYARFAVQSAFAVAPDADFHVVHAFPAPFKGFIRDNEARRQARHDHEVKMIKMIEDEIDGLVASSLGMDSSLPHFHKIVRQGDVHEGLHSAVEEVKPDLLVMGTHGRAGVAHMVLGSVAETFLSRPPCDVLAVKAW